MLEISLFLNLFSCPACDYYKYKNLIEKYPARQKRTEERSFAFNAGKYWNLLPKELRL